ncbi:hypothetical protein SDC9_192048 [bioreactor metagenome]|uniref:Uncharacterized protein n=1 Tax=bioreactor metagenome TaxID=1076179 RepID=A0A645IAM7_9ZZZZ
MYGFLLRIFRKDRRVGRKRPLYSPFFCLCLSAEPQAFLSVLLADIAVKNRNMGKNC